MSKGDKGERCGSQKNFLTWNYKNVKYTQFYTKHDHESGLSCLLIITRREATTGGVL